MIDAAIRLEERISVTKPSLVRSNLSRLPVRALKLIEQNIGRFLAHAQVRQLTKSVDMKAKLDNAVN